MFKRILVAIDGSRTSERAFQTALDLAVQHEAVMQPFYVVESAPLYVDVPGYDPSPLQAGLAEEGAALAREAAEAMKARGIAGSVVTADATASDDVASLILSAASTFDADLLVMGTHGRKGVQRLILGSVAERCLRQATLPVLLVPSAAGVPNVPDVANNP
ncbi:universal stress protein [Caballeronia sp. AZ10_KS36]|uniref:universal stress protein n=1 Tax=Caballeronia sp. AZ10_KS36 TaxID=2921757 RepID=UPI0020292940|nr:universal stress protein [Caballeronia sp. AZ10_KS36]